MYSYGTLLVSTGIGNILKCETIDRLHLLFLWDFFFFLNTVFSGSSIHGEKCLQHKHDCKIVLPFIQELDRHKGEVRKGSHSIYSALPTKAIWEAEIRIINTNEKYWVYSIFQFT